MGSAHPPCDDADESQPVTPPDLEWSNTILMCTSRGLMPVQAPRRLFTVDQFHRMAAAAIFGEHDRIELLSGEIVEMTPIGSRHAACVSRLIHLLGPHLGEGAILRIQDPVRLDDYSEPQPDLAVVKS